MSIAVWERFYLRCIIRSCEMYGFFFFLRRDATSSMWTSLRRKGWLPSLRRWMDSDDPNVPMRDGRKQPSKRIPSGMRKGWYIIRCYPDETTFAKKSGHAGKGQAPYFGSVLDTFCRDVTESTSKIQTNLVIFAFAHTPQFFFLPPAYAKYPFLIRS